MSTLSSEDSLRALLLCEAYPVAHSPPTAPSHYGLHLRYSPAVFGRLIREPVTMKMFLYPTLHRFRCSTNLRRSKRSLRRQSRRRLASRRWHSRDQSRPWGGGSFPSSPTLAHRPSSSGLSVPRRPSATTSGKDGARSP